MEEFLNIKMKIIVIDSHRPLHLTNLFGNSVMVLGDSFMDDLALVQEAWEGINEDEDEENDEKVYEKEDDEVSNITRDDNDSQDEQENNNQDNQSDVEFNGSEVDSIAPSIPHSDSEETLNQEDETEGAQERMTKRKRDHSASPILNREKTRKRRDQQAIIADYYSEGSYYGMVMNTNNQKSVALTVYTMANQCGLSNNDYLWFEFT